MAKITILSNPGSASKKYAVYQFDEQVAWFHFEKSTNTPVCSFKIMHSFKKEEISGAQYVDSLTYLIEKLSIQKIIETSEDIEIVAIRTVIPRADFLEDKILTSSDIEEIKKMQSMDPVHIDSVVHELEHIWENVSKDTHVCMISDSSFHVTAQRRIPVGRGSTFKTIGYHGLSCESVLDILDQNSIVSQKLCICHLGSGCSVSSVRAGKSVYNSMDYSPLAGMVMSTRSGSLDPFLVLQIMRDKNLSYEQTLEYLYKESGLLALSGVSADLRVVREEAFKGNVEAKDAIVQFVDSITSYICKAISYTEGIDTLVFTGTIGCRASYIREMVTAKLTWLGIIVNHDRNLDDGGTCFEISAHNSTIKIYVVEIDEMKEMYKHTQVLLKSKI